MNTLKSWPCAVLALAVLLSVPSCGQGKNPDAGTGIRDASGVVVSPAGPGSRILSLALASDEILADLLPVSRIAALSVYAADPHLSNIPPARLAGVRCMDFLPEEVVALRPDLVLVADWSDRDKVEILRQAGIRVFSLPTPVDIEGTRTLIRTVAALVSDPAGGEVMVGDMDRRLEAIGTALATRAGKAPLRALDWNSWGSANGRGTSWDAILGAAGLANAAGALEAGDFGQVPLSREILSTLDPDLVFVPDWTYGEGGSGAFAASLASDPAFTRLRAWKEGRVVVMPERLKSTVSQYQADAVEFLFRAAWPDLAPRLAP